MIEPAPLRPPPENGRPLSFVYSRGRTLDPAADLCSNGGLPPRPRVSSSLSRKGECHAATVEPTPNLQPSSPPHPADLALAAAGRRAGNAHPAVGRRPRRHLGLPR